MSIRPGPGNSLTDIPGLRVGHAVDARARTGVSVVLADRPVVAAVDVRGGGPGTRDVDALAPAGLVQTVDAICLSGGSVYGLDAAGGVIRWLAERGRGFDFAAVRVPIVPSAVLFDLANGGDKGWGDTPPYARLGWTACAAAAGSTINPPTDPGADPMTALGAEPGAVGTVGAGFGAKAGTLAGGLGTASAVEADRGLAAAALMVANPLGSAVIPGTRTLWAWLLEQDDEFGGQTPPTGPIPLDIELPPPPPDGAAAAGANTTIGVVVTDADLTRAEAQRLAIMAQDGIAMAIRPAHTPFDGDTVFVLATGARPLPEPRPRSLTRLGAMAADCVARAIGRGVVHATGTPERPGYRDL